MRQKICYETNRKIPLVKACKVKPRSKYGPIINPLDRGVPTVVALLGERLYCHCRVKLVKGQTVRHMLKIVIASDVYPGLMNRLEFLSVITFEARNLPLYLSLDSDVSLYRGPKTAPKPTIFGISVTPQSNVLVPTVDKQCGFKDLLETGQDGKI